MRAGELEAVDPEAIARHAPWLGRLVRTWFRAEVHGLEHLPSSPFLGVGNHSGAAMIPDTLVWLDAYYARGNDPPLVILAHDGMFDAYPESLARALSRMGGVRASDARAREALRRGHAVMVYPGGDHDACRTFARRNEIVFAGRTGYVSLAREAGVPIVPVVSAGAHEALFILWDGAPLARRLPFARARRLVTFPVSLSLPWGLFIGPLPGYLPLPTKIALRVLPPIDPRDGPVDAIDRRVRESMQTALDEMARGRRAWVIG